MVVKENSAGRVVLSKPNCGFVFGVLGRRIVSICRVCCTRSQPHYAPLVREQHARGRSIEFREKNLWQKTLRESRRHLRRYGWAERQRHGAESDCQVWNKVRRRPLTG